MRLIAISTFTLLLFGCAEMSKMKVADDGYYYFKEKPVSVWAPDNCLLDMFVYEGEGSVDFTTGRGYWMASGQYALQVYSIPDSITDERTYIEETKDYFKAYMVKDRAPLGLNLTIKEEKETTVNGKPAYQAISVDGGKAVFVATSQLHKNHITIASLVYPWKEAESYKEAIPWKCYEKFVNSVELKE